MSAKSAIKASRATCADEAPQARQDALLIRHVFGMQRPPLPSRGVRVQFAHLQTGMAISRHQNTPDVEHEPSLRQCRPLHAALFLCSTTRVSYQQVHHLHSASLFRKDYVASGALAQRLIAGHWPALTSGWSPDRAMPAARRSRVSAHTPSRAPKRPAVPPPAALSAASSSRPCAANASSHATTRAALGGQ